MDIAPRICTAALLLWVALGLHTSPAAGQESSTQLLSITTGTLPPAAPQQQYEAKLQATGGTPPVRWSVTDGNLPTGLQLEPGSGVISGTPTGAGQFHFTVTVTDAGSPPQTAKREFVLGSAKALTLEWGMVAKVQGDQVNGSVKVSNGSKDVFDQTVIVVAVDLYGKAFALGYERFDLKPETANVEIPFGATLPRGQYVVHADAIAEVGGKNLIYRVRLQTPQALVVTAP